MFSNKFFDFDITNFEINELSMQKIFIIMSAGMLPILNNQNLHRYYSFQFEITHIFSCLINA